MQRENGYSNRLNAITLTLTLTLALTLTPADELIYLLVSISRLPCSVRRSASGLGGAGKEAGPRGKPGGAEAYE